jgi:Kef-type K+ transport system membrane component KefB
MLSIVILLTSFVVAAIGIVGNGVSKKRKRSVAGMSPITVATLTIATVGFGLGIVQQIEDQKINAWRDESLKTLLVKVNGDADESHDPSHAAQLRGIANQIKAISRGMNLKMSDLSGSNFSDANLSRANFESALFDGTNFTNATFKNAKFDGAHFEGVNLTATKIDSATVLPPAQTFNR